MSASKANGVNVPGNATVPPAAWSAGLFLIPWLSGKAVVVPYETRPAPSHRVSLHDDRVFFLRKLEETDGGYVLHTMEEETIEVEDSEIAEIVEFEKD